MLNPWRELPSSPPYVLPEDSAPVAALNSRGSDATKYDLNLFPEPFFGRPDAPVVVLNLNPGWHESDSALHASAPFASLARRSLLHSLEPYPFLHLQPGMQTLGARYWNRKARPLIEAAGFDTVAKNLLCVQYFPYHSKEYKPSPGLIPSQQYGFALLRAAIARGADVVVMRSRRLWAAAVPQLDTYARLHLVRNPRNPALSPRNLGQASFGQVLKRLQSGC
jgi:hypothetical protein